MSFILSLPNILNESWQPPAIERRSRNRAGLIIIRIMKTRGGSPDHSINARETGKGAIPATNRASGSYTPASRRTRIPRTRGDHMSALRRNPFPGRWLPSIIYVGLIVAMGIGLFSLTRLQVSQAAPALTAHSARQ
jgi:hypothetical protein